MSLHSKEKINRFTWEQVKVKIMYDGLVYKFTQHPKLKQKLADTEDAMLVEGNWWEDQTWGVYKGRGLNLLGNLLMIVREQI